MSTLTLVRHGQASFMSDDYDRLSPLGRQQSRMLGAYWARLGRRFDQVYVGPLRRHMQTFSAFADGYQQGGAVLSAPQTLDGLNEHGGFGVVRALLPELAERDAHVAAVYDNGNISQRDYLRLARRVLVGWATGEMALEDVPDFASFRRQVAAALDEIQKRAGRGSAIVAFTSGGTIGAAVGQAFGLDNRATMELNYVVRNTGTVEFAFDENRFSLIEFNAVPHLERQKLQTYV